MENEPIEGQNTPEMSDTPLFIGGTSCEHYMVWEGNGIAICQKGCGHGSSFDPEYSQIVDGKIVDKAY